ncbi:MAG: ABC transporter ATP-binding protein [Pseudomonadota bacterium]
MPQIVLEQVEKSYGSVRVLPPLDLSLPDGEFTVLVGPSGCGKSTTLRILAGLEVLSGGEIYFDERPISRLEPKERDIAMVFQDYALYPHMNIAKNMSFALRLEKMPQPQIDERVNRVANMLNIGHLLARKPAELSGGQRQRVAMGRALVRDAGTFLFDEPLSNLDAKLRAKMRTELAEMRNELDKNMIYVTHDQVEAMTLGDRIVVMNHGLIQQQGTPEELFKEPVNKFVAGFIGSPTMNFLDADLQGDGSNMKAIGDGFALPLSMETAKRAEQAPSRKVSLGVRPSDISMAQENGAAPISLDVVVSEYLGSQSVLATRCGGAELLVETPSDGPVKSGESRDFYVRPEDIMLFDQTSEKRI